MGAWSYGPFENDHALDYLGDLADTHAADAAAALADRMRSFVGSTDYLDGDEGNSALAAACLVAGRLDPRVMDDRNGEDYLARLEFTADTALRELAAQVFVRAYSAEDNEWYALWEESGALDKVREAHEPYRAALGSDGPAVG